MCGTERKRNDSRGRLVLIGGPTCSGKTTLAAAVADAIGEEHCAIVPLDAYYRDLAHLTPDERERYNFDHPDALAWDEAIADVRTVLEGTEVRMPVYDFSLHVRSDRTETLAPRALVVCEGILALYHPALRELAAIRIYMDAPSCCCDQRRIARDTRHRGRDAQSVRDQLERTVHPMAEKFVWPTRRFADIVLDATRPTTDLVRTTLNWMRNKRMTLPGQT